jgi:hypothetical protein
MTEEHGLHNKFTMSYIAEKLEVAECDNCKLATAVEIMGRGS